MVELLELGTEVESCYMAGRGMNGLKAVIVCYNPNNQRYTVELEKGDMMSLKIRNVRAITPNDDEDTAKDTNTSSAPSPHGDVDNSASSLPSFPRVPEMTNEQMGQDASFGKQQNMFDMISPVNTILFMMAVYFFIKSSSSVTIAEAPTTRDNHYRHGGYSEISVPVMITFVVFSFLAWEWGTQPSRGYPRGDFKWTNLVLKASHFDFWEVMGISVLILWSLGVQVYYIVSVGVMFFFLWQFGTRDGRVCFNWDNVKNRAADLNIWEALMLARVLQEGLGFLNSMARGRR